MRRRWIAPLSAALLIGVLAPMSVADPRGSDPVEVATALCPRPGQTTPDCYTIPVPGAQAWVLAAIAEPKKGASALYDSLIHRPYTVPRKRQVAVLSSRLNIPADPAAGADSEPEQGYQEGSIALRVGFPAKEGYPYHEGWFVLAQPINDFGQYESGRDVGIPKYMADMTITRTGDAWRQTASDMGSDPSQENGPGSTTVKSGFDLAISWTPEQVAATDDQVHDVESWAIFGDPLFGHKRPYDDPAKNLDVPFMTKFTPSAFVPAGSAAAFTPLTDGPDLRTGRADVTLTGLIPTTKVPWSRLVDAKQLTGIPGTFGFVTGTLYMTFDDLSNDLAS